MRKSRKLLIGVHGVAALFVRSQLFGEAAVTISEELAISLKFKGLGELADFDGLLCVRGNPNYKRAVDLPVEILDISQLNYQQAQSEIRESATRLCEKIIWRRLVG